MTNVSKAKLILEDGSVFEGKAAGYQKSVAGEVVFATGMVGYEQSLTDPSYAGQILTFTYPLIGNWGVPPKAFWESEKIQVAGVVISDLTTHPSHWQSDQTLNSWLEGSKVPAIVGLDTRALTQKIREKGTMLAKIVVGDQDVDFWNPNKENLVAKVSPKNVKIYKPAAGGVNIKIALLNCGAKKNILRSLLTRGATVYELPWNHDPFNQIGIEPRAQIRIREQIKIPKLDGLVISNGPGDPKMARQSIEIIKKALAKKIPTFGICLGNQLLALAAGGNTYKLKFGHRAQNQPTIQVGTNHCYITTQNHGFAVDEKRLPQGFKRWFYNANDNTNEGMIHEKLPFFSVQFHPEAAPGPTDTKFLFDYFIDQFR